MRFLGNNLSLLLSSIMRHMDYSSSQSLLQTSLNAYSQRLAGNRQLRASFYYLRRQMLV